MVPTRQKIGRDGREEVVSKYRLTAQSRMENCFQHKETKVFVNLFVNYPVWFLLKAFFFKREKNFTNNKHFYYYSDYMLKQRSNTRFDI